ncbi:hypothetical protein FA15DRAFT_668561 [Coprinopsis marcescibilis]|uniref:Glycosyltransferase 61 catalytic domain-containing protein n=1 Tax=Coprinopsis marcescibilis TaxID=230819 RepID=A0A5C3KYI3_COPMA|nr:hypothetical protein FA15DRAFT_668561 [Coprinopsis marcescibilis]
MGPFRRSQRSNVFILIAVVFVLSVWILLYNRERVSSFVQDQRTRLLKQDAPYANTASNDGHTDPGNLKPGITQTIQETTIPSVLLPGRKPRTRQGAWIDGFVTFDRLYLRNGTFYVVTTNPDFPAKERLIGQWLELSRVANLTATDKEMQIIDPTQAQEILGDHASLVPGFTVFLYDPAQFMHHLYHWWGEIILGMVRVYSTLAYGEGTPSKNVTLSLESLPPPSRFVLPAIHGNEWRDKPNLIGPLMRAAYPSTGIEKADYWNDLGNLNETFVFERSMVINRWAAHKHPNGKRWYKMIAGTMELTVPNGFWEPIRKNIVGNILGYVPFVNSLGQVEKSSLHLLKDKASPQAQQHKNNLISESDVKPLVTYISRQGSGNRRLVEEDHLRLVESLRALEKEGLCKFEMPAMEKLSIKQQLNISARSTILVGVHGNGLTHQLFMPASLRSAVFEILDPPSYTFDYEMLARNVGHKHYAVQNDTLVTFPKGVFHQGVHFSPGFHSKTIHVHGPAIADMIRTRLTQPDRVVED